MVKHERSMHCGHTSHIESVTIIFLLEKWGKREESGKEVWKMVQLFSFKLFLRSTFNPPTINWIIKNIRFQTLIPGRRHQS